MFVKQRTRSIMTRVLPAVTTTFMAKNRKTRRTRNACCSILQRAARFVLFESWSSFSAMKPRHRLARCQVGRGALEVHRPGRETELRGGVEAGPASDSCGVAANT